MWFKKRSQEKPPLQDTSQIQKLNAIIAEQKEKIRILEEPRKDIFALFDDVVPKGQTERKKYMGDISLFYTMTFKDKLKHFIGDQLQELAKIGRTERGEDLIRANVNCFRLIDEWMEKCTNEHLGDLEEMRHRFQEDKSFINEVKKTYNL